MNTLEALKKARSIVKDHLLHGYRVAECMDTIDSLDKMISEQETNEAMEEQMLSDMANAHGHGLDTLQDINLGNFVNYLK